jgi:adenine-specific DNA-methyltransferase
MTSKIEDIINIEKMSLESLDLKNKRLNELKKLFPEIFSDGKLNALALSQLIGETSTDLIEKFGLSWSGKFECMRVIQKSSVGTLLPLKDQSINFNDALNVIIEGDNLEVLKLLQKSYYGKIKMIYIDPQ